MLFFEVCVSAACISLQHLNKLSVNTLTSLPSYPLNEQ